MHGGWTADPFASTWTSRVRPFDFVTMKGIVIGRWPIGRGKRRPYLREPQEGEVRAGAAGLAERTEDTPPQILRLRSGRRRARHPLTPSEVRREDKAPHTRSFDCAQDEGDRVTP